MLDFSKRVQEHSRLSTQVQDRYCLIKEQLSGIFAENKLLIFVAEGKVTHPLQRLLYFADWKVGSKEHFIRAMLLNDIGDFPFVQKVHVRRPARIQVEIFTQQMFFEEQWHSNGPVIPDTTFPSKRIYAPGEIEFTKYFKQVNDIEESSTVIGDEKRYFFSGRIEYFDIYNKPHWLTFAFEIIYRLNKYGEFLPYPEYNDSDKR